MKDFSGQSLPQGDGQRFIGFYPHLFGRLLKAEYYSLALGKSSTRAWYIQTLRRRTIFP